MVRNMTFGNSSINFDLKCRLSDKIPDLAHFETAQQESLSSEARNKRNKDDSLAEESKREELKEEEEVY